ncbi:MAG TPA: thioredoxin family protein [Myxococcaceae bacterium]
MNTRGCTVLSLLGVLIVSGSGERSASIPWRTDEARAREEAARSGRPILVDAWADWCAGCKLLDRNTWSDRRVQDEVRARFVPLRVDLSAEGTDTELRIRALGVSALPAVLLCPASACDADARRLVGYAGPDEMLAFLRR